MRDTATTFLGARGPARRAAGLALALVVILAACGDGDGDGKATVAEAQQLLPTPLAAGATSPVYGAPLPKGAEPGPSTDPTTEVFTVAPPVTLSEINAFYRSGMDEKPFGDFAWCGSEVDTIGKSVVRTWRRGGSDEVRTLTVVSTTVTEPTRIVVSQRTGGVPDLCVPG